MTVYEAPVVVSQGNYQDIPECRAKKNLLFWSPQKTREVLENYLSNTSLTFLARPSTVKGFWI